MFDRIILTPLLLLVAFVSQGQSFCSNATLSKVYAESDTAGISVDGLGAVPFNYVLSLDLTNSSVESVTIWMGLNTDGKELLDGNFPTTSSESYTDGTSVTVDGTHVDIGLGRFTGLADFKLRAMGLNNMGGVIGLMNMTYPE